MAEFEQTPFADAHAHSPEQRAGVLRVCNLARSGWHGSPESLAPFCAGIHPKDIGSALPDDDLMELEEVLKSKGAAAVGECGLDRLAPAAFELQTELFLCQTQLAERLGLPLVIHCVRAFPEMMSARKILKPSVPWLIHGFRGNASSAKELARHGFLLSFGAALLKPAPALKEALASVPDSALLLETDEASVRIEDIYAAAAALRNAELDCLKSSVLENFRRAFRL